MMSARWIAHTGICLVPPPAAASCIWRLPSRPHTVVRCFATCTVHCVDWSLRGAHCTLDLCHRALPAPAAAGSLPALQLHHPPSRLHARMCTQTCAFNATVLDLGLPIRASKTLHSRRIGARARWTRTNVHVVALASSRRAG